MRDYWFQNGPKSDKVYGEMFDSFERLLQGTDLAGDPATYGERKASCVASARGLDIALQPTLDAIDASEMLTGEDMGIRFVPFD